MLWHHCFLAGRFEDYTIDFWPLAQTQVVHIASFFKACVSLFAFISGYGLYLSWQTFKKNEQSRTRWLREKLVRTLSSYWFVVVLAWIVCTALDNRPYNVYGFADSPYAGIWKMGIEFLGLSNFFGTAKLGEDWWYISAALVFIVLLPIMDRCLEKTGCFCTMCLLFIIPRVCGGYPGGTNFLSFLPTFCLGMIFAKHNLFVKWQNICAEKANAYVWKMLRFAAFFAILLLVYKLYYHLPNKTWWDVKWSIFPLAVVLFTRDVLVPWRLVNTVLVFLGKHATNIWLVHAFIRSYYCRDFIYGQGHFALVIGMLLLTSLGVSLAIELLKKLVRYDVLIDRLSGKRPVDRSGGGGDTTMIQKLSRHRFLFEELVKRDFKKKYKRTVLGMAWSVLSPLLTLLVMKLVFTQFFGRTTPHYTTYLFCGNLIFSCFNESTSQGMTSLMSNAGIFTKVNVPKYLFLLSKNVQTLINFGLTLCVFFLFCILDNITFTWKFILLLYPIACLVLFNIGVGLILSALFVFFRDIQYLWSVFTMLLMYMSAIFYTIDNYSYNVQCMFLLNPVYLFIRYFRKIVIEATIPTVWFHLLMAADVIIVVGIGCWMYKKYNTKFLYYV